MTVRFEGAGSKIAFDACGRFEIYTAHRRRTGTMGSPKDTPSA
jgi:hypothetical protein